jgi:hypothetical protein
VPPDTSASRFQRGEKLAEFHRPAGNADAATTKARDGERATCDFERPSATRLQLLDYPF